MRPLNIGFVALADAAPLWMAQELGLFEAQGVSVVLSRQLSWATLRDKLVYGELHAAQMLAPMLLSLHWGLAGLERPMQAVCTLSHGGNALVVATPWVHQGQVNTPALQRCEVLRVGTVFPWSLHTLQLLQWLQAQRVDLARCHVEVVPPARMVAALRQGHLDVCCVGEPYGQLARAEGVGTPVAMSDDFWPHWPEKVLGMRQDMALEQAEVWPQVVQAIEQACQWLNASEGNRQQAARALSHPQALNLPQQVIQHALLACSSAPANTWALRFGAQHASAAPWWPPFAQAVLGLQQQCQQGLAHLPSAPLQPPTAQQLANNPFVV